jgi:hypothetical protein
MQGAGEAFRQVNESIRGLATAGPEVERWEFFCECEDVACHSLVTLTLREYDERRAAVPALPIVAHEHAAAGA